MPTYLWTIVCAVSLALPALSGRAQGDVDAPVAEAGELPGGAGMVKLNFPENVSLKVLADYVGQRQGINFIYDQQLASRQVTIKAPKEIPADSLMTLLESTLKMHSLAIVATDVPGTMRIVQANQLTEIAVGPGGGDQGPIEGGPTLAVTRVFVLKHAEIQRVDQVLLPFLSPGRANLTVLPEHNILIITDFASNMKRIEGILAVLDQPMQEVLIRFVSIQHLSAEVMAKRVTELMAGKAKAQHRGAATVASVAVVADERSNQVVVLGRQEEVSEALALIDSLDVSLGLETKIYPLRITSPKQIDSIIKELIGELAVDRLYHSVADEDSNMLIATATPEIHQQIRDLCESMDKPLAESQSPIRFYKLENAKAADVLDTLRNIEGQQGLAEVSVDGVTADAAESKGLAIQGPSENGLRPGMRRGEGQSPPPPLAGLGAGSGDAVELPDARILADEATNTIIVIAKPSLHAIYEKLIKRLDVRRPQVLVEATMVVIDTTDGFQLGVDISGSDRVNGGRMLNFTQFGLSTVDATTGALTLSPGVGFNGALLNANIADVVIRALESDSRAKVMSRPSILVNDNAEGSLTSEDEEPYESVNANNQVATTSFGGFATAGTDIKVTPHISEGDFLKLEYSITLSSFTDERASDAVPPARQSNTLISEATIPDGYTIVVGGLTRETYSQIVDRVPLLGSIPIVKYAFSSRDITKRQSTLFVFIRAVVLRDDKFEDLKLLSGDAASQADLVGDFPESQPVSIH